MGLLSPSGKAADSSGAIQVIASRYGAEVPLPLTFVMSAKRHIDLPDSPAEVALVGRSNVGKSSLLNALASRRLIDDGVATGGMQAKLNAALGALEAGVEQVRIAPGAAVNILDRILAGEEIGTKMVLS